MSIKQGFLCEDFDLNKWVLLEDNLIIEEGVELEVFDHGAEWSKSKWQKAVIKFNKDYYGLGIYIYETGKYKKISSNELVRVNNNTTEY